MLDTRFDIHPDNRYQTSIRSISRLQTFNNFVLREEIKAPLPPIKVSPQKSIGNGADHKKEDDIENTIEDKEQGSEDGKEDDSDIEDNSEAESKRKEEGKISRFFSGLLKRKKSVDQEDALSGHSQDEDTKVGYFFFLVLRVQYTRFSAILLNWGEQLKLSPFTA